MAEAAKGGCAPGGHHVAGEHPPGGARQRHLLGLERIEEAHEPGVRFRDGEERHQGAS